MTQSQKPVSHPSIPGRRVQYDLARIANYFQIPGTFMYGEPYGNGHINDTFVAHYKTPTGERRLIHQRINHDIFKKPTAVMANIARVTAHQRAKLEQAGCKDADRRALTLVPAKDGKTYHSDDHGNTWRSYWFIEKARSVEFVENPRIAYESARAFGEFQRQLVDMPGGRLEETIPDFHNTPKRFAAFREMMEKDPVNRVCEAGPEIEFVLANEGITKVLHEKNRQGLVPERVTHNDTKINNVLIDDDTSEGICVIDLDTVMPGLVLYDFGDMVRTATSPSAEDEKDLSKVHMDMKLFEQLVRGYLETAGAFLNATEKEYLPFSGKLITLEIGIRFLTDFLAGDKYFKIHRPEQNLDRCRTQFKLVRSITEQEERMNKLVRDLS